MATESFIKDLIQSGHSDAVRIAQQHYPKIIKTLREKYTDEESIIHLRQIPVDPKAVITAMTKDKPRAVEYMLGKVSE